jgi:hypothetical protein
MAIMIGYFNIFRYLWLCYAVHLLINGIAEEDAVGLNQVNVEQENGQYCNASLVKNMARINLFST